MIPSSSFLRVLSSRVFFFSALVLSIIIKRYFCDARSRVSIIQKNALFCVRDDDEEDEEEGPSVLSIIEIFL